AALEPKIIYAAAVATRSSAAYWMPRVATVSPVAEPANGSRQRYATFVRQYSSMTKAVPPSKLRGSVRRGFLTSLAVNVTLFHASEEKSGPTIAPPTNIRNPRERGVFPHKLCMLELTASVFRATKSPRVISVASAVILAKEKRFWTIFPSRTPRLFDHVSRAMTAIATSRCVDRETGPTCARVYSADTQGTTTPRNLAKATATAAIVPLWMTRKRVQPYRNPNTGEYAY